MFLFGGSKGLQWEPLPPRREHGNGASQIKNHSLLFHDGHLYVIGGIDDKGALVRNISCYDIANKTWSLLPPPALIPEGLERHSHASDVYGDTLVVHGGMTAGGVVLGDVVLFDFVLRQWSAIQTRGPTPSRRFGHSGSILNGKLIIFGGSDGARTLSDVWALDLATFTWECLHSGSGGADFCAPDRAYHSAVPFAGSLFVFGGSRALTAATHQPEDSMNDFFEFQLEAREWRPVEVRGTPPARCGHAALVYNDTMIVVGGDVGELSEPNTLQLFNFATGAWSFLTAGMAALSTLVSRRFHAAVLHASVVYLVGGESNDGMATTGCLRLQLGFGVKPLRSLSMPTMSVFQPEVDLNEGGFDLMPSSSLDSSSSTTSSLLRQQSVSAIAQSAPASQRASMVGGARESMLKLKCHVPGEEVRLLLVSPDVTFSKLRQLIADDCGLQAESLLIQYKDEENDMIIVKSQSDLDEGIVQARSLPQRDPQTTTVTLYISGTRTSPSLSVNESRALSTTNGKPRPRSTASPDVMPNWRNLRRGPLLSSSQTAQVHLAMDLSNGQLYALKTFTEARSAQETRALMTRIEELRAIDCDNLARLHGVYTDDDRHMCLVVEYVAGGSVHTLVSKFGALSEAIVRVYAWQIMAALDALHSHDVAHGALRSSNVLLDSDGIVKLTDYGFGRLLSGGGEADDSEASLDILPVRCKEDIWRAGCVILDMLTGTTAYSTPQADMSEPPRIPESVSPDAQDFLLQCFNREPASRPSAATCQAHPFLGIRGRTRSRHVLEARGQAPSGAGNPFRLPTL